MSYSLNKDVQSAVNDNKTFELSFAEWKNQKLALKKSETQVFERHTKQVQNKMSTLFGFDYYVPPPVVDGFVNQLPAVVETQSNSEFFLPKQEPLQMQAIANPYYFNTHYQPKYNSKGNIIRSEDKSSSVIKDKTQNSSNQQFDLNPKPAETKTKVPKVFKLKPQKPAPLGYEDVFTINKEERKKQWKEFRQAMKPFKHKEFANAKRTIQRLGKRDKTALEEKELIRLQHAEEYVAAHKAMLTLRSNAKLNASAVYVKSESNVKGPDGKPIGELYVLQPQFKANIVLNANDRLDASKSVQNTHQSAPNESTLKPPDDKSLNETNNPLIHNNNMLLVKTDPVDCNSAYSIYQNPNDLSAINGAAAFTHCYYNNFVAGTMLFPNFS